MLRDMTDDELIRLHKDAENTLFIRMLERDDDGVRVLKICVERILEVMGERNLSVPV